MKLLFLPFLLISGFSAYCQHLVIPHFSGHNAPARHNAARTTIASPAEDNYDVKYLKFNLTMSNTATTLSGDVTTRASVVSASMPDYVFELGNMMTIDSVLINGTNTAVTTSGSIRTAHLPAALTAGTQFTAQVFYHGTPVSGTLYSFAGVYNLWDSFFHTFTYFSCSEPYHADDWWPCKQSLRDKIDSVDMWITVPDSLKAGSNGLLQAVTHVDAAHDRYEWKERNPIDYYLVSFAVAPYVEYSYYMHFTGGGSDSMLIQNFVYSGVPSMSYYTGILDSIGLMVDYFSSLYGRYPFWKEKYGHNMVYWGGAEENQTMTSLGSLAFYSDVVAHELGHQWFGDNVTCGSWRDITMNEGFASYTADLFLEHFHGYYDALGSIFNSQYYVKSYDTGSVYVDDTTSENRILDGRLTYAKGECVLHSLRGVFRNDSNFFHIFRTYQQQHSGGNGTIEDFKNTAEGLYGNVINGINLDTFFNQWLYEQGFPIYTIHWNQVGTDVVIRLDQRTSDPASVPFFSLPLDFFLYNGTTGTTQWVLNTTPSQTFHLNWPYSTPMDTLYPDIGYWHIYDLDSVVHDPTLGIIEMAAAQVMIAPNPAATAWTLNDVPEGSSLTLTDITGRQVWIKENSGKKEIIPAANLNKGVYILHVSAAGGGTATYKLAKE